MNTKWTPKEHQKNTKRTPKEHQKNTKWTPKKHQKNTNRTPNEHQKNTEWTPKEHQKNTKMNCTNCYSLNPNPIVRTTVQTKLLQFEPWPYCLNCGSNYYSSNPDPIVWTATVRTNERTNNSLNPDPIVRTTVSSFKLYKLQLVRSNCISVVATVRSFKL